MAPWEIICDFNGTRSSLDAGTVMRVTESGGAAISGAMRSYISCFFDTITVITTVQSGLVG